MRGKRGRRGVDGEEWVRGRGQFKPDYQEAAASKKWIKSLGGNYVIIPGMEGDMKANT